MEAKVPKKGIEYVNWMDLLPEGFHWVAKDPYGDEGFYSKVGGSFSWYKLGDGQDMVELVGIAQKLHDSMTKPIGGHDYLRELGEKARQLAKPKAV